MVEVKNLEKGRVIGSRKLPLSIMAVRLVGAETVSLGDAVHQTLRGAQTARTRLGLAVLTATVNGQRKKRAFSEQLQGQGVMLCVRLF